MKIGIDAHALGTGAGGNETYMRDLLHALSQQQQPHDITAITGPSPSDEVRRAACFPVHALPSDSSYLRVPFHLPRAAKQLQLDLLHVQYNAPPICPCPYVVSLHDIVWTRFPESLPASVRYRLQWLVPSTLRKARRILVLTNAMRDEIADYYHVPLAKFDIVQPSCDPLFTRVTDSERVAAVREKYTLPSEFLLYIGAIQPRKNIVRLCQAVAKLHARSIDIPLVIVGKQAWLVGEMLAQIKALALGDRLQFTGYVDRNDLPVLLSASSAFAYVSRYEGFGIPVLEALACGVPTVISDDPALREVAGTCAVSAAAGDVDGIADALERALGDDTLRARLQVEGPRRASQFSLAKMGSSALSAYASAISG